jgi:hypothetical protein
VPFGGARKRLIIPQAVSGKQCSKKPTRTAGASLSALLAPFAVLMRKSRAAEW